MQVQNACQSLQSVTSSGRHLYRQKISLGTKINQENLLLVFSIFSIGKSPREFHWGTTHSSCKVKPWNDCIKIVHLSDNLLMISYSIVLLTFTVCWNTLQLCCYLSFMFILKNRCISFFISISVLFTTTSILMLHKHFCVFQYPVQESKSGFSITLRGNELQKDKYICNFLFLDQVTSFSEYLYICLHLYRSF